MTDDQARALGYATHLKPQVLDLRAKRDEIAARIERSLRKVREAPPWEVAMVDCYALQEAVLQLLSAERHLLATAREHNHHAEIAGIAPISIRAAEPSAT